MFLYINDKYYKVKETLLFCLSPTFMGLYLEEKTEENSTNLQDNLPAQPT